MKRVHKHRTRTVCEFTRTKYSETMNKKTEDSMLQRLAIATHLKSCSEKQLRWTGELCTQFRHLCVQVIPVGCYRIIYHEMAIKSRSSINFSPSDSFCRWDTAFAYRFFSNSNVIYLVILFTFRNYNSSL